MRTATAAAASLALFAAAPAFAEAPSTAPPAPPAGSYAREPSRPLPTAGSSSEAAAQKRTALLASGTVLTGAGGFLFLLGTTLTLLNTVCHPIGASSDTLGGATSDATCPAASIPLGLVIGGVVGLATGIPLLVVGAARPQRAVFAGTPSGAGWAWRF